MKKNACKVKKNGKVCKRETKGFAKKMIVKEKKEANQQKRIYKQT